MHGWYDLYSYNAGDLKRWYICFSASPESPFVVAVAFRIRREKKVSLCRHKQVPTLWSIFTKAVQWRLLEALVILFLWEVTRFLCSLSATKLWPDQQRFAWKCSFFKIGDFFDKTCRKLPHLTLKFTHKTANLGWNFCCSKSYRPNFTTTFRPMSSNHWMVEKRCTGARPCDSAAMYLHATAHWNCNFCNKWTPMAVCEQTHQFGVLRWWYQGQRHARCSGTTWWWVSLQLAINTHLPRPQRDVQPLHTRSFHEPW